MKMEILMIQKIKGAGQVFNKSASSETICLLLKEGQEYWEDEEVKGKFLEFLKEFMAA